MNVDAAVSVLLLLVLGLIFYGPWQEACTAYARQVAFEKRDALFDMARRGDIAFDDPSYIAVRRSIEQLIRFAHELTLFNFVVLSISYSRHQQHQASDLTSALRPIRNKAVRKSVSVLVWRTHYAMMVMMLAKSPVTVLPLAIALLVRRCLAGGIPKKVTRIVRPVGERIQLEAEAAPVNHEPLLKAA